MKPVWNYVNSEGLTVCGDCRVELGEGCPHWPVADDFTLEDANAMQAMADAVGTSLDMWDASRLLRWASIIRARPSSPPDEPSVTRVRFEKALVAFERKWQAWAKEWRAERNTLPAMRERDVARNELLRLYDEAASRSPAPPVTEPECEYCGLIEGMHTRKMLHTFKPAAADRSGNGRI